MYNIGIDWEDKGYTVRMVDDSGKETASILRIKKNQEGFNKVLKTLSLIFCFLWATSFI